MSGFFWVKTQTLHKIVAVFAIVHFGLGDPLLIESHALVSSDSEHGERLSDK